MADYGQDWDVKATQAKCAKTQEPFKDGETFMSLLRMGGEGYEREDYCDAAWDEALREGSLSVWQTVYHAPAAKEAEPFNPQDAEQWLRRLIRDGAEEAKVTVYVLALMLERKRQIVEQDVQRREDGLLLRIYEHKKTGDVFVIPDPEVNLDEAVMVQTEVAGTLGWNLEKEAKAKVASKPSAEEVARTEEHAEVAAEKVDDDEVESKEEVVDAESKAESEVVEAEVDSGLSS